MTNLTVVDVSALYCRFLRLFLIQAIQNVILFQHPITLYMFRLNPWKGSSTVTISLRVSRHVQQVFNIILHTLNDWKFYFCLAKLTIKLYSTTVIAKIKEMSRSLVYDIPCYVTMDYEKWYTSLLLTQCEEIRAFEVQNHVNFISRSAAVLTL